MIIYSLVCWHYPTDAGESDQLCCPRVYLTQWLNRYTNFMTLKGKMCIFGYNFLIFGLIHVNIFNFFTLWSELSAWQPCVNRHVKGSRLKMRVKSVTDSRDWLYSERSHIFCYVIHYCVWHLVLVAVLVLPVLPVHLWLVCVLYSLNNLRMCSCANLFVCVSVHLNSSIMSESLE